MHVLVLFRSSLSRSSQQSEAGVKKPYEIGRFDGKTVGEANGLLHALSSDSFLVALRSNLYMSGYLKPLSVLLQGSHLDILEANKEISRVIQLLEENCEKSEEKFHPIFQATCNMTLLHGRPTPEIPRQAGRQTQCSNVPATTPEEYWRRSVFVPFLDTLIAELNGRFSAMSKKAVQALLLTPENLDRLTDGAISDLHEAFLSDLPDDSSFVAELERWRKKWEGVLANINEGSSFFTPQLPFIPKLVKDLPPPDDHPRDFSECGTSQFVLEVHQH